MTLVTKPIWELARSFFRMGLLFADRWVDFQETNHSTCLVQDIG